jgi:response regulator of citrate/malate metabolism
LFNTRNKLVLEHKISKSNKEIDDLIQMKMKANNQKDSMTKRLNDLTLKNEGKLSKLKALVEANAS